MRAIVRPIALLRPLMGLRQWVVARRILLVEGLPLSPNQSAYQRNRSTETTLPDLDLCVGRNRTEGKHVYIAGPDIAGAFDGAR